MKRAEPKVGPNTTRKAMAGSMSTDVPSMALEIRRWTSPRRFRAVDSASFGTSTSPNAAIKAVGSVSRGRVMPNMTPKAEMDA